MSRSQPVAGQYRRGACDHVHVTAGRSKAEQERLPGATLALPTLTTECHAFPSSIASESHPHGGEQERLPATTPPLVRLYTSCPPDKSSIGVQSA